MCVCTRLSENASFVSVTPVDVGLRTVAAEGGSGGGRGRGKGLTSSEPDGFRDTHAVFNLAGGSERTTGSLSPLIFAALKNLQRSRGCAAKAHAHLDSHLSGD